MVVCLHVGREWTVRGSGLAEVTVQSIQRCKICRESNEYICTVESKALSIPGIRVDQSDSASDAGQV